MVRAGDADTAICGVEGGFMGHLRHIRDIIGCATRRVGFCRAVAPHHHQGTLFLADTQVRTDPTAEEIAETAVLAAAHVRRFGLEPKIALVSHSDFGSFDFSVGAEDAARDGTYSRYEGRFQVDGEMHADSAMDAMRTRDAYIRIRGSVARRTC